MWDFVRELQAEGTTLLLTTQYLEEADQLADLIAVIDHGLLIAEGTSDELKSQIGGEVLALHVQDRDDLPRVTEVLAGIGTGEPNVDVDDAAVRIPVGTQGHVALLDSVRRLDEAKITLSDIAMHRPTLDDVFLSLTGRGAEESDEPEGTPNGGRKRHRGRKGA